MNAGLQAESDSKNSSFLPIAWQPLTPRGVAAFAGTSAGRVLLVELLFALLCAAVVIWFLHDDCFPSVREAIRNLPQRGNIRGAKLNWYEESPKLLAASRFLSLTVDLGHADNEGREAHVCVEFGRNDVRVISLFGYWSFAYPEKNVVSFNRPELEPWWGAWQSMMYAGAAMATVIYLGVCWAALAAAYSLVVLLIAFFANRQLSWIGAWKLASASLMPGALFLVLATSIYTVGWIDLIRLAFAFVFHLLIGWVYLFVSPFFLPRHPEAAAQKRNPFGEGGN